MFREKNKAVIKYDYEIGKIDYSAYRRLECKINLYVKFTFTILIISSTAILDNGICRSRVKFKYLTARKNTTRTVALMVALL